MSVTVCKAKNPATCRVHGHRFNASTGDFGKRPLLESHKQQSQRFEFLLTKKQREAVDSYLSQDYMNITPHLYGKPSYGNTEKLPNTIALIDSAINAYETISDHEPKVVYRATRIAAGEKFSTEKQMEEAIQKKFVVGSIHHVNGFMSTTENPEALFDFLPEGWADMAERRKTKAPSMFAPKDKEAYLNLVHDDQSLNNVIYEIQTTSGAPVSSFGHVHAEKEQEYLLGRNKNFRIIEIIPYQKVNNPNEDAYTSYRHATVIRLEEIPATDKK